MIELLYRVVNLSQRGGVVLMILQEVRTVSPEEIERARLEAEQDPETDIVDEGEQLQKLDLKPRPEDPMEQIFWAMRKQFPEMMDIFKMSPYQGGSARGGGGRRVMMAVPISSSYLIEMHISPEQYVEMGSPPLMSILRVSLKLEDNP